VPPDGMDTGYVRTHGLRTLPRDGPRCCLFRATAIQCVTRRPGRHGGNRRFSFDCEIGLDLIPGSFRQLCQIQQTLALIGDECCHVDEHRMNFALSTPNRNVLISAK
jgi:hypothetical protein